MQNGLFITNEFIALVSLKNDSEFTKGTVIEHDKTWLYFIYNESLDPPLELNPEAKLLFYPGNPDVLGNTLRFVDVPELKYKVFDKEYFRFDILDSIVQKVLSGNLDKITQDDTSEENLPFLIIVPPYLSEPTREKLISAVQKNIEPVNAIEYSNPYINSLLNDDKLQSLGNILFVDAGYSDFYFSILKPSYLNQEYKIKTIEEEELQNTEIVLKVLRMIAGELVEKAIAAYDHSNITDDDFLEDNILSNIEFAQDILNEVDELDNWNSVEIDVELNNGKGGEVAINKIELIEKISDIFEKEGIDSKIQYYVNTYQPKTIVLYGENFDKYLINEYFEKFTDCQIIQHDNAGYQNVFKTAINSLKYAVSQVDDKKRAVSDEKELVVEPDQDVLEAVHADSPKDDKTKKSNKKLYYFLIPVVAVIAAFLIYQFIFKSNDERIVGEDIITQNIEEEEAESDIETIPLEQVEDTLQKGDADSAQNTPDINSQDIDEDKPISKTDNIIESEGADASEKKEAEKVTEIVEESDEVSVPEDAVEEPGEEIIFEKWEFDDLNSYLDGIRNTESEINFAELYKYIDPGCDVYRYVNGERTSSYQSVNEFLQKIQLIGTGVVVENSLKYNSKGKITEFGQQK